MANERQFFRDINPGDVSIEGRKSNGVTADINGNTIIYAGIKQSELQKLNQEKYLGNVPIDGYTSTFIAALAPGQLPPYPEGNNNNETYFESKITDPNKITTAATNTVDCANEFDDASTVLLNWENDNVDLGWDPYGANRTGIKNGEIDKAKKYFLDNFWNTNNENIGYFSISSDAGSSRNDPKLLIKNLPPGLRIMAAQFNYNAKQWWTRILAAVGEDWLNSGLGVPYRLTANLNLNGADSYEYLLKDGVTKSGKFVYNPYKVPPDPNKEFTLYGEHRIYRFIDQYDQIIDLYNKDKTKFLSALKDETIRYYTALDGSNIDLLNFHKTYVEKAYELALKYKNCPFTISQPTAVSTTVSTPQAVVNQLPTKETTPAKPAPDVKEEFEFLEETEFAIEPVQLTKIIDIEEYRYNVITRQNEPTGRLISIKIDTTTKSNTTGFDKNNIKTAFDFFISKGFTKAQASGIVGALLGESGLNPLSVNSIGATGIAQWLGGRKNNLLRLPNYKSLQTQLDFIWTELQGDENAAYKLIKKTTTAAEAAIIYESKFERPAEGPGSPFFNKIQAYANDIFSKY